MRGKIVSCFVAAGIAMISFETNAKRPAPEWLRSAVVYQIALRNFTRGGNFKAATEGRTRRAAQRSRANIRLSTILPRLGLMS